MRIAFIAEGQTEYYCLPKIGGRLGNTILRVALVKGTPTNFEWRKFFLLRVVPLVHAMLKQNPEKIIVVLDRENREPCPPDLAREGEAVIMQECAHCLGGCQVAVVIANTKFESLLFADYDALDRLGLLAEKATHCLPRSVEGCGVLGKISRHLRSGIYYDKIQHGMALAQTMSLTAKTVGRSRSLRKLLKELGFQYDLQ